MKIRFSDGEVFDTDCKLQIIRRYDGLYVIGQGMLIPISTREEGRQIIEDMQSKK
jgi:ribosomal protein L36